MAEAIKGRVVVRFDGPPGPESGRFVEVEKDGASINAGAWVQDGDDWLLVFHSEHERQTALDDEADRLLQRKRDLEAGEELEGRKHE